MAAGAVAGSSEPHDRLDPDVTGDVVVDIDVGPGEPHDENDACVGRVNVGARNPDDDWCAGNPDPARHVFVNDHVAGSGSYGSHILSLSAYSETLETFNGGVPVIAIHGTNRPDLIDGAHSNGCVRVTNDIVTQLKGMLPVGTPVQIVRT